jgi:hypothetical protein
MGARFWSQTCSVSSMGKEYFFPEPDFLPHSNVTAPYVMLGDVTYPLLAYLMKPYELNSLNDSRRNFNERLSRARKTVECAFGILYSKWRIISKVIETEIELVDKMVKCVCVLCECTYVCCVSAHMCVVEVQIFVLCKCTYVCCVSAHMWVV